MASDIDLGLQYAPDTVVEQIKVLRIWRTNHLGPLRCHANLKEPLRQIGSVRGHAVLLEHVVPALDTWQRARA